MSCSRWRAPRPWTRRLSEISSSVISLTALALPNPGSDSSSVMTFMRATTGSSDFFMPPSKDELRRRLSVRGSETDEQVAVRMKTAERELELVGKYDHVVINDDVSRATDELVRIIDSYADDEES